MAHTDTVNSLNETLTHSLTRLFAGWRVGRIARYLAKEQARSGLPPSKWNGYLRRNRSVLFEVGATRGQPTVFQLQ
jgi:hypothetical protein